MNNKTLVRRLTGIIEANRVEGYPALGLFYLGVIDEALKLLLDDVLNEGVTLEEEDK
jgi:hypothetical protein